MLQLRWVSSLLAGVLLLLASPALLAATWPVLNGNDGGPGSFRDAVALAGDGDDIIFAPGVTVVTLTSGEVVISRNNLTIDADLTRVIIRRNATSPAFRVLRVLRGIGAFPNNVTIRNVAISNGVVAGDGGGILNGARLLMFDSALSNNRSTAGFGGGGLANLPSGQFLAFRCLFEGNRGDYGGGLVQENGGQIYLYESLVKDNIADGDGGGITSQSIDTLADVFLRNTTFTGNSALGFGVPGTGTGSAINNVASGTGANSNMVILHSTIVGQPGAGRSALVNFINAGVASVTFSGTLFANNAGPNLASGGGASTTSDGYNLSDDNTGGGLPTDLRNTNPLLAPFANYGGPTFTYALLPGSPAINAGIPFGADPTTDARGIARPQQGVRDIGAYESRGFSLSLVSGSPQTAALNAAFAAPLVVGVAPLGMGEPVNGGVVRYTRPIAGASAALLISPATIAAGQASVTATANGIIGSYSVNATATGASGALGFALSNCGNPIVTNNADNGAGSLRQAIADACAASTITFAPAFFSVPRTITLTSGELEPARSMTITGPGANLLSISGNNLTRILRSDNITLALSALTLTAGNGQGAIQNGSGGAVSHDGGTLTLTDVVISGSSCESTSTSGGVFSLGGTLNIVRSRLTGNTCSNVGALYLQSSNATLVDTSIDGNAGSDAIRTNSAGANVALTLTNVTMSGNSSVAGNSAIRSQAGFGTTVTITLNNSTVSGNATSGAGNGAIWNQALGGAFVTVLRNSIVAGNTVNGVANDIEGALDVSSSANNLIGVGGGLVNGVNGNQVGVNDPLLASLANYGGPTPTRALLPGSLAINAGTLFGAGPATDARGIARPQQGVRDIGAYESRGFTLALANGVQTTQINTAFPSPLIVTVAAIDPSEPVVGGRVSFLPPMTGPSASVVGSPVLIGAGSSASAVATANLVAGGPWALPIVVRGVSAPLSASLTNAAPVISISDAALVEGTGGASTLVFNLSATPAVTVTTTVDVTTSNGSASAPADYTALVAVQRTFNIGQTAQTVSVPINPDSIVEGAETFTVTLSNPLAATLGTAVATGTINNDDQATISVGGPSVAEGNAGFATLPFTLSLSQAVQGAVGFNFATADGNNPDPLLNATLADTDYLSTAGTLAFPSGSTTIAPIAVLAVGDTDVEPNQSLRLLLSGLSLPPGINPADVSIATPSTLGTILNDDGAVIDIAGVSVVEGTGGSTLAVFNVSLSRPSKTPVTVQFQTADASASAASDYTAQTATLTFPTLNQLQQIAVVVNPDSTVEAAETFTIALSLPVGATLGLASAIGTINNDDTATVSIANASANEGNAGIVPLPFVITLSNPVQGGVSLLLNTADGSSPTALSNATVADNDYLAVVNGAVSLAAGSSVSSVSLVGDTDVEPDQFFSATLSNLVLPPGVAASSVTIATATASGRIINDDASSFSVANAQIAEGNTGTRTLTFTVALSQSNKVPVSVDFATSNASASAGVDYVAQAGTLNFAANQLTRTIDIVINGDMAFENDETFGLSLSNPLGAGIGLGNALGTIQNDDAAPVISIEGLRVIEGDSGFSNALISVRRSGLTELNASVTFTTETGTALGSDFEVTAGLLTFSRTETLKFALVRIIGDQTIEPDESFAVRLSAPISATIAGTGAGAVVIVNDDGEVVQFASCGARVEESIGSYTASVTRTGNNPLNVTWFITPLSASAGQDFSPVSGELSWAANDTAAKTISIPIIDDTIVETAEELVLALGKVSPGAELGTPNLQLIRIEDNDERVFSDSLESAPCL